MVTLSKYKHGVLALIVSATLYGCGLDGDTGEPGPMGVTGPQGEQGEKGDDASLGITMEIVARGAVGELGAVEIIQYEAATQTVYATNRASNNIVVFDMSDVDGSVMSDPINDSNLTATSLTLPQDIGGIALGALTSIAISGDLMAVAVPAATKTDNGYVLFFNGLRNRSAAFVSAVEVGSLPDMVTFTPDGTKVLVANEGEPNGDYSIDPEGSVAVIDILDGNTPADEATLIGFGDFNGTEAELMGQGMHFPNPDGRTINGNEIDTTVAQDLEPEYIAATNDVAYVTLQENNGLAIVDLTDLSVEVMGLGVKRWSGLNIDARDNRRVSFGQYDGLYGLYMPDSIARFSWKGGDFLVTANEGDAREYFFDVADAAACSAAGGQSYDSEEGCLAYSDEVELGDLRAAPNSALADLQALGDIDALRVTNAMGDADGDGEYEAAYAYGARSFTVWDQNGLVVFDSGDDFERITASVHGDAFNNGYDENDGDSRSADKGPEPEAVAVGTINTRTYAFIGTEGMGGIFVYDVTNPYDVQFAEYVINRDLTEGLTAQDAIGDLAPESLVFVSAQDSPTGTPLLLIGNEASGTLSVWKIDIN